MPVLSVYQTAFRPCKFPPALGKKENKRKENQRKNGPGPTRRGSSQTLNHKWHWRSSASTRHLPPWNKWEMPSRLALALGRWSHVNGQMQDCNNANVPQIDRGMAACNLCTLLRAPFPFSLSVCKAVCLSCRRMLGAHGDLAGRDPHALSLSIVLLSVRRRMLGAHGDLAGCDPHTLGQARLPARLRDGVRRRQLHGAVRAIVRDVPGLDARRLAPCHQKPPLL
jgi:hypothetical protein